MRLLLEVERNREKWQFMTDNQILTFFSGDSGSLSPFIARFHFFPVLKEMCKLENRTRVFLLEQLLSRQ